MEWSDVTHRQTSDDIKEMHVEVAVGAVLWRNIYWTLSYGVKYVIVKGSLTVNWAS